MKYLPDSLKDKARELKFDTKKEDESTRSLAACVPEGTPMLQPDYFDEACIGYEFLPKGGVRLVYAGEVCVDLLRRNSSSEMGYDDAVNCLAAMFSQATDAKTPAFVWGLNG